jgi:peptidoglycan/LPS O-acetylase OafA/YrhL/lysophospholipase L1-like esterase
VSAPRDIAAAPAPRFAWLDGLKGAAIAWIVINHLSEAIWGGPYVANPSSHWPPLADRLAQLAPLTGHGAWDLPLNLLRWVGWLGDQGVSLFLIMSGFGLAWGLLARGDGTPGPLAAGWFFRRRVARVYPLWWGAHVLFLAPAFLLGWGIFSLGKELLLSLAGARFLPSTFYWSFPAWWFIGLLLQLYAVFPLLWRGLRRWGAGRMLAICVGIGLAARAAAIVLADGRIDMALRGALFPTRLPEFALGVALAIWLRRDPSAVLRRLRAPATLLLALAAWLAGMALSATLWGMVVSPLLMGAGGFVLLRAALDRGAPSPAARRIGPLGWLGVHSYAVYLVHHPLLMLLVDRQHPTVLAAVVALTLIVPMALLLEQGTAGATALLGAWRRRGGWLGLGFGLAAAGALALALYVGAEWSVRRFDPQEVAGWGERASLQPDRAFGWKLRPSTSTRLRWLSYDYVMKANSLGFPGPEYPPERAPNSLRILVTGDAFTSAEGVDTDRAWPRLLERDLAARLPARKVEILNFAVTGYGPNQYAAVVDSFAAVYRPDLILIGFFGNDYLDVQTTDDDFRLGIGFGQPELTGPRSYARPHHLRRWFKLHVANRLAQPLRRQPDRNGWFLGQFALLERGSTNMTVTGRALATERLTRIRDAARTIDARVALAMIPAPAQICRPRDLPYRPRYVDLSDTTRFDIDQPQRLARAMAEELGIEYLDLREPLRTAEQSGERTYQRRNLHWTEAGHAAVARWLAERIGANQSPR